MKFLGVDVGTGGTRAVVVDTAGYVQASATVEHEPFASPQTGWAEQDPRDWWRAAQLAIRKVITDSKTPSDDIKAIGFSGQMHGSVVLDDHNQVLRPALLWCDQRTNAQCRTITETVGAERLIELTCNPALTGFTLPKLLWLRECEPDAWRRVHSILLPKDYVRLQLTGDKATDVADASGTLLFDVAARRWSDQVLSASEIDQRLLPKAYESTEVVGLVSRTAAEVTGLRSGTPVVAGAGDQAAGAVGMGIVRAGSVSATIGTSGVVFAATDRPALDPKGRVHTFCHAVPGRWHVMGVTQGAGLSLRWFRDQFGVAGDAHGDGYEVLTREAATVAPGADGLLWTPYLMGERTPHLDPHVRAALVGLTASHTRAHIVRAILEGVAFSLRDTFEIFKEMNVPVEEIRLGGGGARSKLWRQIQADVYRHSVKMVQAEEGAAYGAALLAGVGIGAWRSVETACDAVVQITSTVEPHASSMQLLDRQYRKFCRLYPALRDLQN
ncbi:MAG TPA: xylulokinase [Pyrinomonadaceae bacterium]|jgi:xylulokinase|nr:xylulokinase [Pyrinomonadaceae bacterium]